MLVVVASYYDLFAVMGGTTEPIINALKETYSENAELTDAVRIAVEALRAGISSAAGNATPASEPRVLGPSTLEVAVLDAGRPRPQSTRRTVAAAARVWWTGGDPAVIL